MRELRLELKVLADVGLLGFPNAGKSTFIRAVSAATPRVADYPFTTLQPHLGVVRIGTDQSFVIADIPGLIEGAAEGAGLGIQFLKHVSRTRLLLHLVDMAPLDEDIDPVEQVRAIEEELEKFDPELLDRPRWLVFNKADLLPEDERQKLAKALVRKAEVESAVVRRFRDRARRHVERVPEDPGLLRQPQSRGRRIAAQRRRVMPAGDQQKSRRGPAFSSTPKTLDLRQRLDVRRQAALMTRRLVLVDQAAAGIAVHDRLGVLVRFLRALLVLRFDRVRRLS